MKTWLTENKPNLNKDNTELTLINLRTVLSSCSSTGSFCLTGTENEMTKVVCNLHAFTVETFFFPATSHLLNVLHRCHLEHCRINSSHHYLYLFHCFIYSFTVLHRCHLEHCRINSSHHYLYLFLCLYRLNYLHLPCWLSQCILVLLHGPHMM